MSERQAIHYCYTKHSLSRKKWRRSRYFWRRRQTWGHFFFYIYLQITPFFFFFGNERMGYCLETTTHHRHRPESKKHPGTATSLQGTVFLFPFLIKLFPVRAIPFFDSKEETCKGLRRRQEEDDGKVLTHLFDGVAFFQTSHIIETDGIV